MQQIKDSMTEMEKGVLSVKVCQQTEVMLKDEGRVVSNETWRERRERKW